ncbi:triokinase/FMN cyclase isoform X1 [Patella vulgata]|uniref:triokinase/FMN cyclase isoform X1 n=2 Tax=Patella vulgata TaxID=6465 RepID=UPI0021802C92|nr:triokinase/FMN cyclase isoform X1 [Patella vulgata]
MSASHSKRLINSVQDCVDENLDGFVSINTGIRRVIGHRIMVREDYQDVIKEGKVSIVSGGGSGHEPQTTGSVGKGMLTACIMGSIFASPPSQEILLAIRLVAKHNPAGCLLIISNYTGDKLNFGVAMEKARQEGIRVGSVTVGEDCALVSQDKSAGRRGLVGVSVTFKLAGALSEEGRSLEEMIPLLNNIICNMGSMGLSLTACTIPGSGATFTVADDEMELGLGVHGEAGIKTLKLKTAKESVKIVIEHMTNPENRYHIKLSNRDRIACFINNLGGTTNMEMNIISGEILTYLKDTMGVVVERAYSGSFVTSQEMCGFIVTLLHVDDTLIGLLDARTDAPIWPHHLLSSVKKDDRRPINVELENVEVETRDIDAIVFKTPDDSYLMYDIINNICKSLISSEARLNLLDTEGGDGDCGSTLSKGAQVLLTMLGSKDNPGLPVHCPYLLSLSVANIAENYMGGSSGALYSLMLTSGANCVKDIISPTSWHQALHTAINTIKRYGGAELGDRTMLDPLYAASEVIKERMGKDSIVSVLKRAAEASELAARQTANMKARAGRASYVSADRLKEADPGAVAVALWMRAMSDTIEKYYS